jgi:hypothetical protein
LNLMASEAMAGRLGFRENYGESFFYPNVSVSYVTGMCQFCTQYFNLPERERYIRHLNIAAALAEEPGEDNSMLIETSPDTMAGLALQRGVLVAGKVKRRSINPEAGHALVILGHAIEYLADEFIYEGGPRPGNQGQVDAIQLLIRSNRQIYMACPEVPTFTQRLRSWLHPHERASAHSEKLASGLYHGQV